MTEKTLSQTIDRAILRALRNLAIGPLNSDGQPTIDGGWEPDAMRSWVSPTVIRAVQRYVADNPKKNKKKKK